MTALDRTAAPLSDEERALLRRLLAAWRSDREGLARFLATALRLGTVAQCRDLLQRLDPR